jgi:hypothetical protein
MTPFWDILSGGDHMISTEFALTYLMATSFGGASGAEK